MFNKRLIALGVAVVLLVVQESTEGKPGVYRRKRFIEDQNGPDYSLNEIEDNDISTDEENRNVRRSPVYGGYYQSTFPPFPGDEDDYDRFIAKSTEREPQTTSYYIPPTTTTTEVVFDRTYDEIERKNEDESEPLHKQVVPWLKRQWGHTKGFFKKHYQNVANQLG